ncbi:MAG: hypothetical protein K0V04_14550 [Deltaproteobacteria bacterium]|nr:hypothetical protein [Deltaproteobacteria bacterium]
MSTGPGVPLTTTSGTTVVADGTTTANTTEVPPATDGGQDCCSPHASPGCEDPDLAACVCETEAFCCAFSWDEDCVAAAEQCGGCGAATTEPGTTTAPVETTTAGGDECCTPSGSPGCAADPVIEACVCGTDPFCCDKQWDGMCADQAEMCGANCGPVGGGGDCCAANGSPGCDDQPTTDCVCALDPFCCDNEWDDICVGQAQYACMFDCGLPAPGGDCCAAHDGPECDDPAVTMCTCDQDPACCVLPWDDGCVLTAVNFCGQVCPGIDPLDPCCFEQPGAGCAANPAVEACVCALDAFCCSTQWDGICVDGAVNNCMLDCGGGMMPPVGMGDCCAANGSPGCELADVESCVCGVDPFCCSVDWDGLCVDVANNDCGGCMGGGSGSGSGSGSSGGFPPGVGDCCAVNGSEGCDDAAVQDCVCQGLPFCCNNDWVQQCVDEANLNCMAGCAP